MRGSHTSVYKSVFCFHHLPASSLNQGRVHRLLEGEKGGYSRISAHWLISHFTWLLNWGLLDLLLAPGRPGIDLALEKSGGSVRQGPFGLPSERVLRIPQ
jgi:hypothetical protein